MIKAVIIEDEMLVAKDLQKQIGEIDDDIEILAVLSSLEEAKKWLSENKEPDLLFMDIQLSDGVSFELFNSVQINCPIIFTTAYDEFAIRAFKVNSIDYLLKPVDIKDLEGAVQKFKRTKLLSKDLLWKEQMKSFIADLGKGNKKKYKERFMVHWKNTMVPISKEVVSHFVRNEIIYLVTKDNQRYVTDYDTMDSLEELLNPEEYFRANRQHIIYLDSVENIKHHYNGKVIAKLKPPVNIEIDISREKAASFKEWLG